MLIGVYLMMIDADFADSEADAVTPSSNTSERTILHQTVIFGIVAKKF